MGWSITFDVTVVDTIESPDDIKDVVGLEVDHLVDRLEGHVPVHPLLPVGLHHLLGGQEDLALDQLHDPHGAGVEHGEGVGPEGGSVIMMILWVVHISD